MKAPDLAVSYRDVASLIPYARNARTHSESQVAQIAASIREFGWTNPILVDGESGLIAGHGRLQAARALGLDRVPVIELAGLTAAQKRAYVLADNRLALNAGWDADLLGNELGDLKAEGFDLGLLGFSDDELANLLNAGNVGLTDEDAVPALQDAVSVPGDVWLLGRHRLVCGDSTVATDVAMALNGVTPHLMVTDPPYGVNYDPSWREKAVGGTVAKGKVANDDRADWREAWALFPGDVAYVWQGDKQLPDMAVQLADCGLLVRNLIVWAKTHMVLSRGDYHSRHETCWYAVRKGGTGHWSGDRTQTTLWSIEHRKNDTGHGTQKPVECMRRPIENNSSPGQAVYEPFSGSGTTIIAAEQTGRACLAIELEPAYVDVAVRRWQEFTGLAATLEGDGRSFDELKNERLKVAA